MRKIYMIFMCLFFAITASAQQTRKVDGKVTEQGSGIPLIGVSVLVKGSKVGASTAQDGKFSIMIPKTGNATLVFTYIGYLQKEIIVGDRSTVNVILAEDSKTLSDVVVIGYGTSKKADLVSSVGQVNMKDMLNAPVRSFDEALAGRVAGVQVTSSDGQPGSQVSIVIRGANSITQDNSPLYVIDGFPIEGANNNVINPQDIESMDVLKDAAATAIYGARGANGVIMITTKKGKTGNPVITLSTTQSFTNNNKRMDLMSSYDFVKYQLERDPAIGTAANPTPTYYFLTRPGKTLEDYKNVAATDWQSPFFQTGSLQDYNLAIRGGSQQTLYSISGSANQQDGTIINTSYKRYQGRITLDQTLSKYLKVGINANYSYLKQSGNSVGASTNSGTTNILYSVWGSSPTSSLSETVPIDETTNNTNDYKYNPLLNQKNLIRDNITRNISANTYAELTLSPTLKFRATGVLTDNTIVAESFNNSLSYYGNPKTNPGMTNGVNGSILTTKSFNWANENTLTWNKTYNKIHNLNVLAGFTQQGNTSSAYGFGSNFLPNESLGLSGLDEGISNPAYTRAVSSLWTAASFLGRIKYNYKSKYYAEVSYRADGSSKFSEEHHWSYFPATAFAWRFKQEDWAKNISVISDGKLRLSYGQTGNNRVGDFSYLSTSALPVTLSYSFNDTYVSSVIPGYNINDTRYYFIGNKDLKWETTDQYNAGLDISFFKNRINLTVDAYRKITKDLLLAADIPTSSGYNRAFKNIGKVQNQGLEFAFNTVNIDQKNFKWTSSFNISFNRNKVLALAENQEAITTAVRWDNNYQNTPAYIAKIGRPLGDMYGFVWDGNYQYSDFTVTSGGAYLLKDNVPTNGNARALIQPGDIKYKDLNNDGVVNASDYTIIGNGLPVHIGGFGNNFSYKNFDLNVFLQWSYGNDIQNTNRMVFEGNGLNKTYLQQFASYNDRWSPDNQNAPNYRVNGFFGGGYSSRTVEDGSYLRIKTVSFGYNIPANLLKKVKVQSLRVYVSGQNLYTFTKYTGLDPEVNSYASALTAGFDYSAYPRGRTIAFGANLSF
ncbi:MAG: TonB-dependent receptor [Candidatus Pedobacter colombiensis]|uniref:TonB-dependent receptor n=1 Tax=Candidatus Pedobacter colombiensis TaxID=3121371 RepID=A0AAJ5WA05_9SPHI|nr:TonB-dependent receptor [Pedobacter sp.]WEK20038.1 MAG: TonB-dependent receptor [Pedobacter sp.]